MKLVAPFPLRAAFVTHHRRSFARVVAGTLVAVLPLWPSPAATAQEPAAARLVAVGDIHGALDEFVSILKQVQLIDDSHHWTGGATTFVQTGDLTDRGAQVRGVMDLLMALETEAKAAGGRALVLVGNHEVMNLIGETRDVTPAIFATFADEKSEERRQAAYTTYETLMTRRAPIAANDKTPRPPALTKEDWMTAHPPGFIEYFEAFAAKGKYGAWLRARSPVGRVGDSLFLHAGFEPETAPPKAEDVNDRVRDEIRKFDAIRKVLVDAKLAAPWFTLQELLAIAQHYLALVPQGPEGTERMQAHLEIYRAFIDLTGIGQWTLINPNGALWSRGFAQWPEAERTPAVTKLLERYKASRFVVGHTVTANARIAPRFENRVFVIDTGMLTSYYKGRPSALEVRGNVITAIYTDKQDVLVGGSR